MEDNTLEKEEIDLTEDSKEEPSVENGKTEETKETENSGKMSGTSKALLISVGVLAVVVLGYIIFQGVFVILLNSGKIKNDVYDIRDYYEDTAETTSAPAYEINEEVLNPFFSLEEAAAVYDPNKTTLSVVDIARTVTPSTCSIYIMEESDGVNSPVGAGSGFIISSDGYIVTNAHVISSAEGGIKVAIPGFEDVFDAEIVGYDEQTDIGVVKVDAGCELPCVTLGDSDRLLTGELAVAIGNPLGTFESSVTVGVISGLNRQINNNGYNMTVIQTDASVNNGNSGGPLINSFGEVIGIINAKISSAEGLGFAIPINDVTDIIESLIEYGKVINRPYLGVTVKTVIEGEYFGGEGGVYVEELVPNGPADEAGMEYGDLIISIDGTEIRSSEDILTVRDSHEVGDSVSVIVERDGREVELTMIIGDSADYV